MIAKVNEKSFVGLTGHPDCKAFVEKQFDDKSFYVVHFIKHSEECRRKDQDKKHWLERIDFKMDNITKLLYEV